MSSRDRPNTKVPGPPGRFLRHPETGQVPRYQDHQGKFSVLPGLALTRVLLGSSQDLHLTAPRVAYPAYSPPPIEWDWLRRSLRYLPLGAGPVRQIEMWWRRGESNPCPKLLNCGIYMLSLAFESHFRTADRQATRTPVPVNLTPKPLEHQPGASPLNYARMQATGTPAPNVTGCLGQ